MNQTQRNYAIKRVEGMVSKKLTEIKEKHTTPTVTPDLSDVLKVLRSGKAKLRSEKEIRKDWRFGTALELDLKDVFSNLPEKKKGKVNQAAIDSATAEIKASARAVIDEIMLGDEATAMKLLKDFEKELAKK